MRLTNHNPGYQPYVISANKPTWRAIYDRLCEYEDAEEQGLLVPVRHGRWISDHPIRCGDVVRVDPDGCPVESCHCSVCGDWLTASDEYPVIGRYCPNCGARMDLVTDYQVKDGDGDG